MAILGISRQHDRLSLLSWKHGHVFMVNFGLTSSQLIYYVDLTIIIITITITIIATVAAMHIFFLFAAR